MKEALPPSSSDTFLTVPAACFAKPTPAAVDPVNDKARTVGLSQMAVPICRDDSMPPVTRLSTPVASPACSASAASATAVSGVCGAGFTTIVQPAARAAAAFRRIIAAGKFQGVIAAATPIGWRITSSRLSA